MREVLNRFMSDHWQMRKIAQNFLLLMFVALMGSESIKERANSAHSSLI